MSDASQHPLIAHVPAVASDIKFLHLAYFERLLLSGRCFPRCQDLPDEAFGLLHGNSMLVSISHGWHYQVHPDPFSEKAIALRDMLRRIKAKFPFSDIYVFFDFCSLSQRPFELGQAQRTPNEQASFDRALGQMHHCYCYSDLLIHINCEPPADDLSMFSATLDMSKVEVVQIGSIVQVIGLHGEAVSEGLAAFDLICKVDGVEISSLDQIMARHSTVHYLRRPFGKINPTPTDERGWMLHGLNTVHAPCFCRKDPNAP